MAQRKTKNWISSLLQLVEDNETPRIFWFWSALFMLSGAVQRKVWLPYGIYPIYPNMYILTVGEPGKFKKSLPPTLAKEFFEAIGSPVFADSPTRRSFLKHLAALSKEQCFYIGRVPTFHCSTNIISKELSSFLATDPKGMIEILTDMYDTHDTWKHETSGQGSDIIKNVFTSCYMATTPGWVAENLSEDTISGGFAARFVVLRGFERYKSVAIPKELDPELRSILIDDLQHISEIHGEFSWGPGAEEHFTKWYDQVEDRVTEYKDYRVHGYIYRSHVILLKTAMLLRIATSDDLTIRIQELTAAERLIESVLDNLSEAFGSQGKNTFSGDMERIMLQLRAFGSMTFENLMKTNFPSLRKPELVEILDTIVSMGVCSCTMDDNMNSTYTWKGGAVAGKGGKKNRLVDSGRVFKHGESYKEKKGES